MITMLMDEPLRLRITTTDGKVHVLDVEALTVEGAARKAPAKAALVAPKEKKQLWTPEPRTDAEIKDMLRGMFDQQPTMPRTPFPKETCKLVLEVICTMRLRAFKQAACPYSVRDAQVIAEALANGIKPSLLGRAIIVASTDDWWRKHGDIAPEALIKNVAALSARYDAGQRVRSVLTALRAIDKRAADDLEAAMPTMSELQQQTALREASARVASAKAKAGGDQ